MLWLYCWLLLFCWLGVNYLCSQRFDSDVYPTCGLGRGVLRHKCADVEVELVVFLFFLVCKWLCDGEVDLFGSLRYLYFSLSLSGQLPENLLDRRIVVEVLGFGVLTLHVLDRRVVKL